MIPYFVALDVIFKICQAQLCSVIRDCHPTILLKNTLFEEEVAWQPLVEQECCSFSILEPLQIDLQSWLRPALGKSKVLERLNLKSRPNQLMCKNNDLQKWLIFDKKTIDLPIRIVVTKFCGI